MILTEVVNVRTNGKNKERLLKLGYKQNPDYTFNISPKDLWETSMVKIIVQCDEKDCDNIKEISYYSYHKTVSSVGHYRCRQCGCKEARKTNLRKYGTEYPIQLPEIKEKQRQTNLERYGVENTFQRSDFQELKKETILKRYGVEHQLQSNEIKEKIKKTNLNKYGVEHVLQSFEIKEKIKKTNLEKYGVERPMQNEEVRDKAIKTCRMNYGVDYPLQSLEIRQKIKQTNLERYGTDNILKVPEIEIKTRLSAYENYGVMYPLQNKEIREKAQQTNLEKYGVKNPFKLLEVQQKIRKTNLEKYGVEYIGQNIEIKEKIRKSLFDNNTAPTSRQQKYLCNLFKGYLNYPIKHYSGDIVLLNEKIDIEYSGGGHWNNIIFGAETEESFKQKEIKRFYVIKQEGYKQIEIISRKDWLPSDEILLQMLKDAKQYFKDYPKHSWINFDIDNQTIRNAEYERSYFYGELRKITKEDLKSA